MGTSPIKFNSGLPPEEIRALQGSAAGVHKVQPQQFLGLTAPKNESIGDILTRKYDGGNVNSDMFIGRTSGVDGISSVNPFAPAQSAGKTTTPVIKPQEYIKNGGNVNTLTADLKKLNERRDRMAGIVGANDGEVHNLSNPNSTYDDGVNFVGRNSWKI